MKRKERHTLEFSDGRRVKYRVEARPGDPHYFVYFRGPSGRTLERSTEEGSRKRAVEAAVQIIKDEYRPERQQECPTWEDAIAILTRKMKAQNSRKTTINDYLLMISNIRKAYPTTAGPANISPGLAKNFITVRSEAGLSAYTIRGNIIKLPVNSFRGSYEQMFNLTPWLVQPPVHAASGPPAAARVLSVIWAKWFIRECEILSINPWCGIEKPKVDEPEPRYIEPAEEKAFFDWLSERWGGWRLPVLFFTVKGFTGRRISQLCSLPSSSLKDGRIAFPADINKSRRPEYARVPDAIFRELAELAGPTYVWERYPDELNAIYRKRGKRKYARCQDYLPDRLKRFLQYEIIEYNRLNKDKPGFVPFTAHNFRDTAMTKAWDADIDLDRAAIAYGCNRETMKKHYIRKEALAVADAVFIRVQSRAAASTPQNGQHVENPGQSGNGSQDVGKPRTDADRPAEGAE